MRCALPTIALSFILSATTLSAQPTSTPSTNRDQNVVSPARPQTPSTSNEASQQEQTIRLACIEGRRLICGRILDLLPDGMIVESGYTNLLREPLSRSWLIPGTAKASRAENLIESKSPGAICVGHVLLTNTPKSKKAKPAKYDYVIVQAYPAGQYTYTSAGTIQRTVRRFSADLVTAVRANLETSKIPAR